MMSSSSCKGGIFADYEGKTATKALRQPVLLTDDNYLGRLLTVDGDSWQMTEAQFTAFNLALRQDSKISFKDNVQEYFSGVGSSAVLLKMGDVQGR